jgi:hypothetical protein
MNERPEQRHVVAQWVSKAEEDLTAAEYLLTMGEQCPSGRGSLSRRLGTDYPPRI